jgi:simple sugar transport system ATP-binding protein
MSEEAVIMERLKDPESRAKAPALSASGVSKRFGAVLANDAVSVDVYEGEIHAVVGENGAGKTTLMQILSGSMAPDSGVLTVRNTEVRFSSPLDAGRFGIGMVHQHYSVVPEFSVLENLLMSVAGPSARLITKNERKRAIGFLEDENFAKPATTLVQDLAVDEVQRFEIAKLMYNGASILILDEPTAVLGPIEVDRLYERLRDLAARGRAIMVITHKLAEVERFADRVTVMRAGATVIDSIVPPTRNELLRAMFGGRVDAAVGQAVIRTKGSAAKSEPVLTVSNLGVSGPDGRRRVEGVSFGLAPGEVLAVIGVEGNGQSQLMDALAGIAPCEGTVRFGDQDITNMPARERRELGIRAVTEDRHRWDVFMEATMTENLMVHRVAEGSPMRYTNTRGRELAGLIQEMLKRFDVRPVAPQLAMSKFSGGNQQRAVVARESEGTKSVLLLAHPTRGLDVVGASRITESVAHQASEGVAVLWNTADIDEAFAVSDRILVMCHGEVTLIGQTSGITREQVALAISGTAAS